MGAMLLAFLFGASLQSAERASMECVEKAEAATVQTRPLLSPAGVVAVLKIFTGDDHIKDSHECMVRYQLLLVSLSSGNLVVVDLLFSDGEWGRSVSVQLDGFSADGKRVFGTLAEGGKGATAMLLAYDALNGDVELPNLGQPQKVAAKCGTTLAVVGTAEAGEIVMEQGLTKQCGTTYRWILDRATHRLQRLPPGKSVVSLFKYTVDGR
jgi:hypothetical protein